MRDFGWREFLMGFGIGGFLVLVFCLWALIPGYATVEDKYDLMRAKDRAWELYQESVVQDYVER